MCLGISLLWIVMTLLLHRIKDTPSGPTPLKWGGWASEREWDRRSVEIQNRWYSWFRKTARCCTSDGRRRNGADCHRVVILSKGTCAGYFTSWDSCGRQWPDFGTQRTRQAPAETEIFSAQTRPACISRRCAALSLAAESLPRNNTIYANIIRCRWYASHFPLDRIHRKCKDHN
jgi:hypothetical protein